MKFCFFKDTLRALKFYIQKKNSTARSLVERVLKTLFTTRWYTNLSLSVMSVDCVGPHADRFILLAIFKLLLSVTDADLSY